MTHVNKKVYFENGKKVFLEAFRKKMKQQKEKRSESETTRQETQEKENL